MIGLPNHCVLLGLNLIPALSNANETSWKCCKNSGICQVRKVRFMKCILQNVYENGWGSSKLAVQYYISCQATDTSTVFEYSARHNHNSERTSDPKQNKTSQLFSKPFAMTFIAAQRRKWRVWITVTITKYKMCEINRQYRTSKSSPLPQEEHWLLRARHGSIQSIGWFAAAEAHNCHLSWLCCG